MNSLNWKDPLIVVLLVIAGIIFITRILPLLVGLASAIFWIALFILIVLYVYPPTRGIIERFIKRIFK